MPQGEYLQYGGQAVVEGVMMRSPRFFSVACRAPNGQILVQTEAIEKTWVGKQKWLKYPFLRGSLALLDSMALGSRAFKFAANIQLDPSFEEKSESAAGVDTPAAELTPAPALTSTMATPGQHIQSGAIGLTLLVSFVIAMGLFVYLPNLIAEASQRAGGHTNGTRINLVAELIKVAIFIGYLGMMGMMKDIREIFKYHGAEHKAINTLEADQPLEIDCCLRQTRLHPRCGTSFAIIVLILGLVTFTFVPRYPVTGHQGRMFVDLGVRVLLEILILPVIAGIAYELLRIAGKFRKQTLVNILFKPGIWSQYLTTREPEPAQVEVALESLRAVMRAEQAGCVEDPQPLVIQPGVAESPA